MEIRALSSRPPQPLTMVDDTAQRAAQRMLSQRVNALVVTDAEGRAEGVVTADDLVLRCLAEDRPASATPVGQLMTRNVQTVQQDTPVEIALEIMARDPSGLLVVVDEAGRALGLVSLDDLLGGVIEDDERPPA